MKEKIKLAVIGLKRGGDLIIGEFAHFDDVEIIGVCDLKQELIEKTVKYIMDYGKQMPFATMNYKEILDLPDLDAVIVSTTWDMHFPIAIEAMKAGIYVGLEVGGAYTLTECEELVRVAEQTGHRFMFLENCCYSRREMMALEMAKRGLLGEIVHCEGAYSHDLRRHIVGERSYRLEDYLHRNCENYPTHEIGPIAKLLHINRGNRFVSLVSVSSKASGLNAYARKEDENHRHANTLFAQGDVVTTILKCANGETVTITLDTTLPCPYSRKFTVFGTEGRYIEDNDSVYIDGVHNEWEWLKWHNKWGNAAEYAEEYDHPLWKEHRQHPELMISCHGGTDWVSCRAFTETVKRDITAPIDVYDAAVMMCISVLSEQSISLGGQPVPFPDFTRGEWLRRKPENTDFAYSLDF